MSREIAGRASRCDAGAEVATVDRDGELEEHGGEPAARDRPESASAGAVSPRAAGGAPHVPRWLSSSLPGQLDQLEGPCQLGRAVLTSGGLTGRFAKSWWLKEIATDTAGA